MTRVKICGCMRVEDALVAKEAGADFIGINFAPRSRRRVAIEEGQAIVEAMGAPLRELGQDEPPPLHRGPEGDVVEWFRHGAEALERLLARKRPLTVGVFQDQPMEEVDIIADECGLDLIQLSGRESWADCLLANRQVIKGVDVPPGAAPTAVIAGLEAGTAIACMLDVSRGRGVPLDRGVAAEVARRLPVWLAGGLTPENVSDAVREVRPWAVDVSSGVETEGEKDAAKVRAFVHAAGMAISA
jgi:anthranilate synthase/indole-3-glycerol phosphate synthase/phosphoribosylanthranilate isomerase